jgi:hypothetical protein
VSWPFSTGRRTYSLDHLSPSCLACRDLLASQEPSAHHNKSPLATSHRYSTNMATYRHGQNTASTACVMPRPDAAVSVLDDGFAGHVSDSMQRKHRHCFGPELPLCLWHHRHSVVLGRYTHVQASPGCCLGSRVVVQDIRRDGTILIGSNPPISLDYKCYRMSML